MGGADWGRGRKATKLSILSLQPLFGASPVSELHSVQLQWANGQEGDQEAEARFSWSGCCGASKLQFLKRFRCRPQLREKTLFGSNCLRESSFPQKHIRKSIRNFSLIMKLRNNFENLSHGIRLLVTQASKCLLILQRPFKARLTLFGRWDSLWYLGDSLT